MAKPLRDDILRPIVQRYEKKRRMRVRRFSVMEVQRASASYCPGRGKLREGDSESVRLLGVSLAEGVL